MNWIFSIKKRIPEWWKIIFRSLSIQKTCEFCLKFSLCNNIVYLPLFFSIVMFCCCCPFVMLFYKTSSGWMCDDDGNNHTITVNNQRKKNWLNETSQKFTLIIYYIQLTSINVIESSNTPTVCNSRIEFQKKKNFIQSSGVNVINVNSSSRTTTMMKGWSI